MSFHSECSNTNGHFLKCRSQVNFYEPPVKKTDVPRADNGKQYNYIWTILSNQIARNFFQE